MISYTRPSRRVLKICLVCLLLVIALPSWAADKVRLRVDDYQIDAELLPHVHKIAARAKVKFTALEDLNTATMNITVPSHMLVIGSGKESQSNTALPKKAAAAGVPTKTYTFIWDKPSFPGTIVAGMFQEFKSTEAGLDLHVFFKPVHQKMG